ncbi:hypothetical protein NM208_g9029 [Fusarium decemcellulare]|uniref:Uncharacterized protein n=1 Tax=Fusarium decemcellulare TaxID=57161 RepID=A0ACC1S3E1_9HYPO|nr:hypothetical protein NM208_g9029 [Fusarium decemcellulare]
MGPGPDTRSGAPGVAGFLDLPPGIRKDIYELVLEVGHPIYLFQDSGPRIETFAPDKPKRWTALLHTNRQLYSEAKAVLYAKNYFYLMDKPQQQDLLLQSFLDCIGPHNAASLSRLCISFPVVEKAPDQPEAIRIREDSLRNLGLVQGKCTNLKTLEMQVSRENSRFLIEAEGGHSQFVRDALMRIDGQLKAISPVVEKIIVRLFAKDLPSLAIDTMRGFGWVLLDR